MGPVAQEAQRSAELAGAAASVGDFAAAVTHLGAAIRGFTASGDKRKAAMACARLGDVHAVMLGNQTAGRAWFARASRLVADEPPCVEQGWIAVAPMGCEVDDPVELLDRAELALDRANRFADVNLETKAMADSGLAHVQVGRLAHGMQLLDEAMALACGPADDGDAIGRSVCSFFTACYFAADFARADSWAGVLRQKGIIGPDPGGPIYLSSHCDSVKATMLCELGHWGDADALLTRAIADCEATMPMSSWHPAIALADLRIRQGRLADAEMLLLGKDHSLQALLPTARLHCARGDYELARATAARGLCAIRTDRLRAAELLTVLVDVGIAVGDIDAAAAACADLEARTAGLDCPALLARTAAARARTSAAGGDFIAAIEAIDRALDALPDAGAPWLRASLHIDLARLQERTGNLAGARVAAKVAAAMTAGLDVVLPAGDSALLDRLTGSPSTPRSPGPRQASLARHGRWWEACCDGTRVRLADTKGLRYLAELVANPGVERHALDLVDRIEGVPAFGVDRHRLGDAGELIDGRARAAYRRRIEVLHAEVADALELGLGDRAEALQAELDHLVAQLAAAYGLGGRARRAASAAERARLNVTRAIRAATTTLEQTLPGPGAALDRGIRTGLYCVYEPAADDDVQWVVQS